MLTANCSSEYSPFSMSDCFRGKFWSGLRSQIWRGERGKVQPGPGYLVTRYLLISILHLPRIGPSVWPGMERYHLSPKIILYYLCLSLTLEPFVPMRNDGRGRVVPPGPWHLEARAGPRPRALQKVWPVVTMEPCISAPGAVRGLCCKTLASIKYAAGEHWAWDHWQHDSINTLTFKYHLHSCREYSALHGSGQQ